MPILILLTRKTRRIIGRIIIILLEIDVVVSIIIIRTIKIVLSVRYLR